MKSKLEKYKMSNDTDLSAFTLKEAVNTLIEHYNGQLETMWSKIAESRSKELTTIDKNFKELHKQVS